MRLLLKQYRFLTIVMAATLSLLILRPATGLAILRLAERNFVSFVVILTPVFVLVGLMDTWIDRQTIVRLMGNRSGPRGAVLALMIGAITAVPSYALLPMAGILLRKGSRISNVLIFVCSSSSIRIPLLLFEASSLGIGFTLVRLAANMVGIFLIALITNKLLSNAEQEQIYQNAARTDHQVIG